MPKKTKAQLERDYEDLKAKFEDCRRRAEKATTILSEKLRYRNAELERRNKKRDEVDWPSIEGMLKPWGFDPENPVSLKIAIARIVHRFHSLQEICNRPKVFG